MDKKQKEALIIALAEKGETYRDITKKAGVKSEYNQGSFE
jgi:hypothetical protein